MLGFQEFLTISADYRLNNNLQWKEHSENRELTIN